VSVGSLVGIQLSDARLGQFKPLADFDWDRPRHCDRTVIEDLMSLEFLRDAANIVLVGPNWVGKSTIAANLAHRAIIEGHTVRFTTAGNMLGELAAIDSDSLLQRKLRFYARQQLLIIDEVGYFSYSNGHADLLFNIVSSRSQQRSTRITTNRPFAEWARPSPTRPASRRWSTASLTTQRSSPSTATPIPKGGRGTPEEAQRRAPTPAASREGKRPGPRGGAGGLVGHHLS